MDGLFDMRHHQKKVVVIGGGTAGVIAAIAAARQGCSVCVIEQNGYLGGVAGFGIPFLAFKDGHGRRVVGGIAEELIEKMKTIDASPGHVGGAYWNGPGSRQQFHLTPYDPEGYKVVILQMAQQAGVSLQLHAFFHGVEKDTSGRVTAVWVTNKDGLVKIDGDVFIDATGDADVVRRAGFPCRAAKEGQRLQNVSGIFVLGGVSAERALDAMKAGDHLEGWDDWHTRIVHGDLVEGQKGINHFAGIMKPWQDARSLAFTAVSWRQNVYSLNISRTTGIDGSRQDDLVRAEISERNNMYEIYQAIKRHVPGFENSFLMTTSPMVGIRESVNIAGLYTMTAQDVLEAREHDDNIARGCYPIDIHDPKGGHTQFMFIRDGGSYGIPFRSLVPAQSVNLLVAGRCLSATHEAHGSTRIMATAMAVGEAAGTAAALAVSESADVPSVDIKALQKHLRQQGAILDSNEVIA